jgi:acyl-CoA synthetase (AMP-forming)/AMP-acid ligase II
MTRLHSILFDQRTSSHTAVVDAVKDYEYSYETLAAGAVQLANQLRVSGVSKGDRVLLFFTPGPEFVISLFAAFRLGAVPVPVDWLAKPVSIRQITETVESKAVLYLRSLAQRLDNRFPAGILAYGVELSVGIILRVLPLTTGAVGASFNISRWTTSCDNAEKLCCSAVVPDEADALIVLTSGSTGRPKGVRLSHRGTLLNIEHHMKTFCFRKAPVLLHLLPVHFSYGLIASLLSCLFFRGTTVFASDLAPVEIPRAIQQWRPNFLMGTPNTYRHYFDACGDNRGMDCVEKVAIGGEAYGTYHAALLRFLFPTASFYTTYGLTEAGPRVSTLAPEFFPNFDGCIGAALQGVELRIDCASANAGRGELLVRSSSLMNGYVGFDHIESDVICDGWLRTGDLAYQRNNQFHVVGRMDRQFKLLGKRVHPGVIESHIKRHPNVQMVIVKKTSRGHSEVLQAHVVTRNGHPLTPKELRGWCGPVLPLWMIPSEIVNVTPTKEDALLVKTQLRGA